MRSTTAARLVALALSVAPMAAAGRPAPPPVTHVVRMVSDGKTARFEPAEVTLHPGDRVRFVNAAGGPHNVSFDPARLPEAVRRTLQGAMANQIQPLWGPLLTEPNQSYTINFAGVTPGRYEFFCMPHMGMGMRGVLIVR